MAFSKDLTKGSEAKILFKYSLPFIAAILLQALFNVTDIMIAGFLFGRNASAGVGIAGQINYLVINAAIGLGAGGTIMIAQRAGKGDHDGVKKAAVNLFYLFLFAAVLFVTLSLLAGKPLLKLLKTPLEALGVASSYIYITIPFLPFVFIYNAVSAVLRGIGDSNSPLYIIAAAFVMNILFDLLFVAILKWGVKGVAWGTVCAEGFAAVLSVILILKMKNKTGMFKNGKTHWDGKCVWSIFKMGVPIAVLNTAATVSFMLLSGIVNAINAVDTTAYCAASAILTKYNGFAVLPSRATASSVAGISAQNIGAGKWERNRKTLFYAIAVCLTIGLLLFILTFFFHGFLFHILGADAITAEVGAPYMRAMSFDYIVIPFAVCTYGIVEGFGKTWVTMLVNVIGSLAVRVPLAYLLAKTAALNMLGVGISIPVTSLVCAVLIWVYIIKKKYLKKNTHFEKEQQNKKAVSG